ncbi:hypothetical protein [Dermabacter vaginalis]|nr:hypothetical protein [Dermabacter vaginalis]
MVSVADLPDLDNPTEVDSLADALDNIAQDTKSIVGEAGMVWATMDPVWMSPESSLVQVAMVNPIQIAEEIYDRNTQRAADLRAYADELEKLTDEKSKLEAQIESAIAALEAAEQLPDTVPEENPSGEGEPQQVPNPEKERQLAAAHQAIAAAELAVSLFLMRVQTADRALAAKFTAASFGPHTVSSAFGKYVNGSFFDGLSDAVFGILKLQWRNRKLKLIDALKYSKNGTEFFFRAAAIPLEELIVRPYQNQKRFFFGGGINALGRGVWRNYLDFINPDPEVQPSVVRHTAAWLTGGAVTIAHDPARTVGELAPTAFTGGGKVVIEKGGKLAYKNFKVGSDGFSDSTKRVGKKLGTDVPQEALDQGLIGAYNEAVADWREENPRTPIAPPEDPNVTTPGSDQTADGVSSTGVTSGTSHSAPGSSPIIGPPSPKPSLKVYNVPPAPPAVQPQAALPQTGGYTQPIESPAEIAEVSAEPTVPDATTNPANLPILTPETMDTSQESAQPTPAPVSDTSSNLETARPVSGPEDTVLENLHHLENRAADRFSIAAGVDKAAISETLHQGWNVSSDKVSDLLEHAIEANPELLKVLREKDFTGDLHLQDLEEILAALAK